MTRIYFDTCSLQRPLDDRTQPRINVEAEAVLTILRFVASGDLELVSSEVIQFELAQIPDIDRQTRARELLELASEVLPVVDEIESQAAAFVKAGLKPVDALHLATAFWNKAEFFCTCDDKILKKSKKLKTPGTRVVSPLELVAEVAP